MAPEHVSGGAGARQAVHGDSGLPGARLSPRRVGLQRPAGIQTPRDLEGKRVGVRAYTVTTGVWARGILVERLRRRSGPGAVGGVRRGARAGVPGAGQRRGGPGGREDGGDAGGRHAGRRDRRRAGGLAACRPLLPIGGGRGGLVGRRACTRSTTRSWCEIAAAGGSPGWRRCSTGRSPRARRRSWHAWAAGEALAGDAAALAGRRALVGDDPLPYGLAPNRAALEMLARFAHEQRLVSRVMAPDELFAAIDEPD